MTPSRQRFAPAVRSEPVDLGLACLLIGAEVEPDLEVDESLAVLDALAVTARAHVPVGSSPAVAAEGLRLALGEHAGFAGYDGDFNDVRSSLLHEVLRRGRGLPLLLSVVWLEVAARLDVPAYAIGLPGHVVVGLGDAQDVHVVVDPFAGGRVLDAAAVAQRVQTATGGPLLPEHLAPMRPADVLVRLLNNVRALTLRQAPGLDVVMTRLWAVELTLLLPRHPVELRRERGELLVRLGQHERGAEELETFALVVESADEALAATARREARLARAQLN